MLLEGIDAVILKWIRLKWDRPPLGVLDLRILLHEVDGILATPDDLLDLIGP